MNKFVVFALCFFLAFYAFSAGKQEEKAAPEGESLLEQVKAEGKATFYANITAIEPIMEEFTKN